MLDLSSLKTLQREALQEILQIANSLDDFRPVPAPLWACLLVWLMRRLDQVHSHDPFQPPHSLIGTPAVISLCQRFPKCGAQTAPLRKSQGICLKCRFPGHTQAYCIRIRGRDKAGRTLYFDKHLRWFIGILKFENHKYRLIRTILSWLSYFPAFLGLRRNEQWRYKFSRGQLISLIDVYWMAYGCQALF